MTSPVSLTLRRLRATGFSLCAVVEHWNGFAQIRQDLWGFADVLGVDPQRRVFLLVQSTSRANVASRLKKARARTELAGWLQAGGQFQVHGWFRDAVGKWQVRIVAVEGADLSAVTLQASPRCRRKRTRQPELFD